ncbi:hypothetical protein OG978_45335 (plasmid) [Streptomyces sp. NBC_01591]|uniref:hypothetical protein n=1 Tax=Streptomyces sp. NBC_01591 TaxID=2975888 RepID=UPI002DDB5B7F|nr:hypothetical protein [Streptomyces sp. NBC_01591]WSD74306.1 hypothetical protein OG978_45335 [Streptomyces sp. NBC_01591]
MKFDLIANVYAVVKADITGTCADIGQRGDGLVVVVGGGSEVAAESGQAPAAGSIGRTRARAAAAPGQSSLRRGVARTGGQQLLVEVAVYGPDAEFVEDRSALRSRPPRRTGSPGPNGPWLGVRGSAHEFRGVSV